MTTRDDEARERHTGDPRDDELQDDLDSVADSVRTRHEFAAYVRLLRDDVQHRPEEWENATLPAFLDALAAWT